MLQTEPEDVAGARVREENTTLVTRPWEVVRGHACLVDIIPTWSGWRWIATCHSYPSGLRGPAAPVRRGGNRSQSEIR